MKTTPTIESVSRIFGASQQKVRAQYTKNSAQLEQMAVKACASKAKMYRGYTPERLREMARNHRTIAE